MWVFIRKLSGAVLLLLAVSAGGFLLTARSSRTAPLNFRMKTHITCLVSLKIHCCASYWKRKRPVSAFFVDTDLSEIRVFPA